MARNDRTTRHEAKRPRPDGLRGRLALKVREKVSVAFLGHQPIKIEQSRDSFASTAFPQHWLAPRESGHETNLVAPVVKLLVIDRSVPN